MDVDVIVPGHGPLADKYAVRELRSYFEYIEAEARKRFEAGMTALEAASDIALDKYADWGDPERVVVNVDAVYRELSGLRRAAPTRSSSSGRWRNSPRARPDRSRIDRSGG